MPIEVKAGKTERAAERKGAEARKSYGSERTMGQKGLRADRAKDQKGLWPYMAMVCKGLLAREG